MIQWLSLSILFFHIRYPYLLKTYARAFAPVLDQYTSQLDIYTLNPIWSPFGERLAQTLSSCSLYSCSRLACAPGLTQV